MAAHLQPQRAIRYEVVVLPAKAANKCAQTDRKDILTLEATPDARELLGGLWRLRPGRHERRVERAD
jgi:hypothetical protein